MKTNTFKGIPKIVLASFLRRLTITLLSMLIIWIIAGQNLYAQNTGEPVTVSGQVISSFERYPIPGANVYEKENPSRGTVTDVNGRFTLTLQSSDAILVVSYLGFITEEIRVGNQRDFAINLSEDIMRLEEFVVVGYGTMRKSDLTGSVTSISAAEIDRQPITQLHQVLQGRAPGVMVSANSGGPGSQAKIRIRGLNSIFGNNEPLYIVDGMTADPNGINMNDVESFEVLKDASATAIYGNRGANGVVLITTKKGSEGKPVVEFEYSHGLDQIPNSRFMPVLTGSEYMEVYNASILPGYFSEDSINSIRNSGDGTNWQKEMFRNGIFRDHQLSVRGGTDKANYFISGNLLQHQGVVVNTDFTRYAFRANVGASLSDKIKLGINSNLGRRENHNNLDGGFHHAITWSPHLSVFQEDGNYTLRDDIGHPHGRNPVGSVMGRSGNNDYTFINTSADLKWEILPGLTFNPIVGLDFTYNNNKYFSNPDVNGTRGSSPEYSSAGIFYGQNVIIQNSNILNYTKTFNSVHTINITGVNEWISHTNFNFGNSEDNIPDMERFGYYNLGLGDPETWRISSGHRKTTMVSFLGRANYAYGEKYMLTASIRADGSSKFQGDNKWGYFPSAAFAWRMSEEDFMKDLDVFSQLKWRVSYGRVGSQAISPYQTLSVLGSAAGSSWWHDGFGYPYDGNQLYRGYGLSGYPNPSLRWESTDQINAGVDIGVFQGRLSLSLDYYNKKTSDMLYPRAIPAYKGGGSIMQNVGSIGNRGFEFLIDATPLAGEFQWNVLLNGSFMENEVLDIGGEELIGQTFWGTFILHRTLAGRPVGSFYMYDWQGVWKEDEAELAAGYGRVPGESKYLDVNDDGKIDTEDIIYAGSAYPDFYWGFTNNFSWRNFDLNIFITGSHGAKLFNHNYLMMMTSTNWSQTYIHRDALDVWDAELRPDSDIPSKLSGEILNSTRFLEDASYARLRNVALSYTFSRNMLGFGDIRLSVSAQNLLILTKYRGWDPELSATGPGQDVYTGFDAGVYPMARTFTLGIKGTF
jgi:TonB-dependent starch-binding outer membrane protein SusC